MCKKRHSVFEDHGSYVTNSITKPYKAIIFKYAEHIRESFDLAKYISPTSKRGGGGGGITKLTGNPDIHNYQRKLFTSISRKISTLWYRTRSSTKRHIYAPRIHNIWLIFSTPLKSKTIRESFLPWSRRIKPVPSRGTCAKKTFLFMSALIECLLWRIRLVLGRSCPRMSQKKVEVFITTISSERIM